MAKAGERKLRLHAALIAHELVPFVDNDEGERGEDVLRAFVREHEREAFRSRDQKAAGGFRAQRRARASRCVAGARADPPWRKRRPWLRRLLNASRSDRSRVRGVVARIGVTQSTQDRVAACVASGVASQGAERHRERLCRSRSSRASRPDRPSPIRPPGFALEGKDRPADRRANRDSTLGAARSARLVGLVDKGGLYGWVRRSPVLFKPHMAFQGESRARNERAAKAFRPSDRWALWERAVEEGFRAAGTRRRRYGAEPQTAQISFGRPSRIIRSRPAAEANLGHLLQLGARRAPTWNSARKRPMSPRARQRPPPVLRVGSPGRPGPVYGVRRGLGRSRCRWPSGSCVGLCDEAIGRLLKRLAPTFITLTAMTGSVGLLALAMRAIPLSTAYPIWTGIGGDRQPSSSAWTALGEQASPARVVAAMLIIAGLVLMKLSSSSKRSAESRGGLGCAPARLCVTEPRP